MTEEQCERLTGLFERHKDEYLRFERTPVYARPYKQRDLCAFAHLAGKLECDYNVVIDASHDKIVLGFDELENLTEEDVIYITRCGVMFSKTEECLWMFA